MGREEISDKEFIMLTLLIRNGEMTGMDLVEQSEGEIKLGTVYTTLYRMEDKELISSRDEDLVDTDTHSPRRLYKATAQGVEACRKKGVRLHNLTERWA